MFIIISREHFEKNADKWQEFYNSKEPHKFELPDNWQTDLNEFQRMIVLRCIRPDKVLQLCFYLLNQSLSFFFFFFGQTDQKYVSQVHS